METEKNTATETETTAVVPENGETIAAGGAAQETKQEPATKTYEQAYIDNLLADQKAAKELVEWEEKIALRECRADVLDILANHDVSSEFADLLVGDTTEKTKENVAAFKTMKTGSCEVRAYSKDAT